MIMQLQLDIRESRGNGQHKVQEEYETLAQGHGRTKKGLSKPKGEISAWAPNAKGIQLGHPCIGKLYHLHNVTSSSGMKVP